MHDHFHQSVDGKLNPGPYPLHLRELNPEVLIFGFLGTELVLLHIAKFQ